MKRIKIAVLLVLLCVLAGCSPKDTSLRAYCTESQQEFLDQSLEELPVALTYHHNDNILGRYETTDEEIISEILQALRETTIVSKAFSGSSLVWYFFGSTVRMACVASLPVRSLSR